MDLAVKPTTIKFLCSYGGRILPRYPDGKLRYHGGETRVLSVQRSISFAELLMKLGEMSGTSVVNLRCQLPKEDLDALVSITSDEDLANLIEGIGHGGREKAISKRRGSGTVLRKAIIADNIFQSLLSSILVKKYLKKG
ncbi:uncharacterized protein LOC111406871 [Olea europaea var. sylvestris]|uniref:uncharacterized protein LOC111406871 n=1 Tax=Olea europaea var. sylvestris TaxID=158386 RepID=UPI000C1CE528|nr:uncharacterized protein LOC111406871 [Olea europaea var. sylvestris]